jgi:transposase
MEATIHVSRVVEWRDIYPREKVDDAVVQELISLVQDGVELDPIVVAPIPGRQDVYALVDGAHRMTALASLGRMEIRCVVLEPPTQDDKAFRVWALGEAARRNLKHGKALTARERKNVIERLYAEGLGITEIAERLGVTPQYVSKILRPLRRAEDEMKKSQVLQLIQGGASLRKAAQEAGVSPATALRWAKEPLQEDLALQEGPPQTVRPEMTPVQAQPTDGEAEVAVIEEAGPEPTPESSGGANVWEAAYRDWAAGMSVDEVAKKYGLPVSVVRYRQQVDAWRERARREWEAKWQEKQDVFLNPGPLTNAEEWLFRPQRIPVYGLKGRYLGTSEWPCVLDHVKELPRIPADILAAIRRVEEAFERGEAYYAEWAQPEYSSRWSDLLGGLAKAVIKAVELAQELENVDPQGLAELTARKEGSRNVVYGILFAVLEEVAGRLADLLDRAGVGRWLREVQHGASAGDITS